MAHKPTIQSVNIIILGKFNPAIFHPSWFAGQDLIRPEEADAADIQIVHPEASVFQFEWCQLHVVRERFQIGTSQEPYFEPLRDLASGVFSLLNHTPVRAIGINRHYDFRLASEKTWHAVGHQLAPKDIWHDVLQQPGIKSLIMQGQRPDKRIGSINVKLEPSSRLPFGIFIEVNDHYELESDSKSLSSIDELVEILSANWNESMQRSDTIAYQLAGLEDKL